MADFPTTTFGPTNSIAESPATEAGDLRSSSDSGYVMTRRVFTRTPKLFSVNYSNLNITEHDELETFIDTFGTSLNFNWTHPLSGVVYDVRFKVRPTLTGTGPLWFMDAELEEV